MAKAKKITETKVVDYKADIKEDRLNKVSTPTRFFKVGQRVQYGNIDKSVVKEILFDGKFLVLDEVVTNHNYGNPYQSNRTTVVAWHSIVAYDDYVKSSKTPAHVQADIYPLNYSQRDLESLIHMKYQSGIELDPDYQRDLVWTIEDKTQLIESIFNYVDIGKFVFFRRNFQVADKLYEIIDGKQRLSTLIEFYEDRFKYKGKLFSELNPSDQRHITNYPASVAFLERVDKNVILNTFVRLNTGGRPQDPTHLEKVKKMIK